MMAIKKLTLATLMLGAFLSASLKSTFADAPAQTKSNTQMTDTANKPYSCTFSEHGWNAADWMFARRSDMESRDEWTQKETYIENKSDSSHSFTSMVYRHPWKGNFTASADMAFADRMAPSIVLAWEFGKDAQGRQEYLTHMELVLFDQGINVWLHRTVDGKPVWIKTAYARFALQKDTKYQLQVSRKGKELFITVGDHNFGYLEDALPEELYVGVTAAEGINRLYEFSIR